MSEKSELVVNSEHTFPLNEGKRIKNSVIKALDGIQNKINIKGVFDKISDSDVEKNIPMAEATIIERLKKDKNITSVSLKNYANMRDGLALFYAASEKGDKKAAKLAYEAAYMPDNSITATSKNTKYSKIPPVKEDEKFNSKDSPRYSTSVKTGYKPISNIIYGNKSKNSTSEESKRIKEICEKNGVSSEHARIIYYAEKWKNIPEYKWTTFDVLYWITLGKEGFIHSAKISYIENYKDVVLDAAEKYDLPPLLIAGVMYIEYGGDPMWADDIVYSARVINPYLPEWIETPDFMNKEQKYTSYGNISIQVRRATEMLGYDNNVKRRQQAIKSLKDPIQSIYMAACHLNELRNVDFEGKSADELTEEDIKIIASRYNIGLEPAKNAVPTEYGQRIYNNKAEILKALK